MHQMNNWLQSSSFFVNPFVNITECFNSHSFQFHSLKDAQIKRSRMQRNGIEQTLTITMHIDLHQPNDLFR